jgi:hypothetical protein
MQTAENKQPDSFLIAEFRGFFRTDPHFRTPVFCSPLVADSSPLLATRHSSALSEVEGPLAAAFSNRQTPELLEMNLSCRKQTEGVVSNRQCFAFFPRHSVPCRIAAFRRPFPSGSSPFLATRHSPLATAFLIGTQNISREKLTRRKQTTSLFLIGTENGFFQLTHSPFDFRRFFKLITRRDRFTLRFGSSLVTCHSSQVFQ